MYKKYYFLFLTNRNFGQIFYSQIQKENRECYRIPFNSNQMSRICFYERMQLVFYTVYYLPCCLFFIGFLFLFAFFLLIFAVKTHKYIYVYIYIHTYSFLLGSESNSNVLGCCEKYIHTYLYMCIYIYFYIYKQSRTNLLRKKKYKYKYKYKYLLRQHGMYK